MKISELRARENYDENLEATIRSCLKSRAEQDSYHGNTGQGAVSGNALEAWYEHPWFSVYVTKNFCAEGRQYLRAQYRHAPKKWRRLIQAPIVDLMSMRNIFDGMIRPALALPVMKDSQYKMWMPGNHRFRLFDFKERIISVYPKSGFSLDGIQKEIRIRQQYGSRFRWMLPIIRASEDAFDEPLLNAVPMNRESSGKRVKEADKLVKEALHAFHQMDVKEERTDVYLGQKRGQFELFLERVHSRFSGLSLEYVRADWERAARVIERMASVRMSLTHGDFQPGNVLIKREGDIQIWLIDWEDADVRATVYDAMTWMLGSREHGGGLDVCEQFDGMQDEIFSDCECSREEALALWNIEEWNWILESSSRKGITRMPPLLMNRMINAAKKNISFV